MFTGLIREIGILRRISPHRGVLRLVIEAARTAGMTRVGDSIAVGGICLTATEVAGPSFTVEAAAETRRLTTLGSWRPGRRLHLEPALRMGDGLDGHLVQGHVDGLGTVQGLQRAAGGWHLTVAYPEALGLYLTPKGSIAVDGVSLTVDQGPFTGTFTANLIPHTMHQTTFARLRPGQAVNLEMDVLVKAARQGGGHPLGTAVRTSAAGEDLTIAKIRAAGFTRAKNRGTR